MSYVLVGESPNRATVRRPELWLVPDGSGISHTANRLRDLAGWTTKEYLRVFARRDNVLPAPPRGGRWLKEHTQVARDHAAEILQANKNCRIVCLGKRSLAAFSDVSDLPAAQNMEPCVFHLTGHGATRVAYLPHTSGLNRWWNDAANRILGIYFLRGLGRVCLVNL